MISGDRFDEFARSITLRTESLHPFLSRYDLLNYVIEEIPEIRLIDPS